VKYYIHGGEHRIGGMCIEVADDDGTRVLLDLGMPLYDEAGADYLPGTSQRSTAKLLEKGVLPAVGGLYRTDPEAPQLAAIFLTHSHADHHGLAHHAHPAIPVWGSRGTVAILRDVGRVFSPKVEIPAELHELPARGEPLRVSSVTVTAIPVDHSAPDSRAFLVEADGKRLLYTGDLRAHGRTGYLFEKLLADPRLHRVDVLLHEATTKGRGGKDHGLWSEVTVEKELTKLAKGSPGKLVAVMASGQNVDRLVSCYKAAWHSGRLLVIDPYQAYVLRMLKDLSERIPQFTWERVKVGVLTHQMRFLEEAGLSDVAAEMRRDSVSSDAMAAEPGCYLVCARGNGKNVKLLDKIGADRVELVWSMWSGYWDKPRCWMRLWAERNGVDKHTIHSGGHAWPGDLDRLVDALEPVEVRPVHTDTRERM
jgi:ribonuclease J